MTQFSLGILGFFTSILGLMIQSAFEFVVNPLLTFFVEGFTMTAAN